MEHVQIELERAKKKEAELRNELEGLPSEIQRLEEEFDRLSFERGHEGHPDVWKVKEQIDRKKGRLRTIKYHSLSEVKKSISQLERWAGKQDESAKLFSELSPELLSLYEERQRLEAKKLAIAARIYVIQDVLGLRPPIFPEPRTWRHHLPSVQLEPYRWKKVRALEDVVCTAGVAPCNCEETFKEGMRKLSDFARAVKSRFDSRELTIQTNLPAVSIPIPIESKGYTNPVAAGEEK